MLRRLFEIVAVSLTALSLSSSAIAKESPESLSVGDEAPVFEVQDDSGKTWKSSDHFGKHPVVVYFYPADMTGGCTAQACGFRDRFADLKVAGAEVVGVSGDSVENHQLFKKAHSLNFPLLADVDGVVANAFGVPVTKGSKTVEATINGTAHQLIRDITAKRWTFVVGADGKILYKDDAVVAKQDSEKILALLKK